VTAAAAQFGGPHSIGELLFTTYMLPMQLVAMLLLAAMVGAIVLTHKEGVPARRRDVRLAAVMSAGSWPSRWELPLVPRWVLMSAGRTNNAVCRMQSGISLTPTPPSPGRSFRSLARGNSVVVR